MPWTISLLESPPIVLTVYSGSLSRSDLHAAAKANIELAREHGVLRFLGDCLGLAADTNTIIDIYELVELYESLGLDRRMREALVLPGDAHVIESLSFYETAAHNRGFNVRLFNDLDAARAWLAA